MAPSSPLTPIKRADSKSSIDRLITRSRPRSLQKQGRPSSLFGSLRSLHSLPDDDNDLARVVSTPTSTHSASLAGDVYGDTVLHHGEAQTAGGMFRKKNQYFVLTDSHLVRFKSQARASEIFPSIPSSLGRASGIRHSRMSSSSSLHELHASTSSESQQGIPLSHVVAVWRLEDGKPYFSIQISHLDEETYYASDTTLQLHDPRDCDLWLSSLRGAVMKQRLNDPKSFTQGFVDYTARALEQENDYDPEQFRMFKVVQRERSGKAGARSSSEDLTKISSTICILAIGAFKVHLVPLPRSSRNASSTSLSDMTGVSHGIMALTSLAVHDYDDAFQLTFRLPLQKPSTLLLAASHVSDIALYVRHAADYLRPEWLEAPFTWNVPQSVDDEIWPIPLSNDDYQGFDRTLTAYSAAYNIDTSRIRYFVNCSCEDAPAFELHPPDGNGRTRYTVLELLAIMRSLRYNESFTTISFRNISLDVLHSLHDRFGDDHVPLTNKSGEPLHIEDHARLSILIQEVQALAVKCKRLRRLDFAFSLHRKELNDDEDADDAGCGLCQALFPLCARQQTNVDWIILNGIALCKIDVDYLYGAALDRSCHFRALDLAYCGLNDRSMETILEAIEHQSATMESIDLSGNLARLDPWALGRHLGGLEFIRKINLSNISRTSGVEPLFAAATLLAWKLVEIRLARTTLNEQTVEALATYLRSDQSNYLRILQLDQCKLTGSAAAVLLTAMDRGPTQLRNLHIQLNENHLEQHHDQLLKVIRSSYTPNQVTMQMLEYKSERNFQRLLEAFALNKSTRYLDISKAALPADASDDTCDALHRLLAENDTLEVLNISGEHSHLEAANFGSGLNHALVGLKDNLSLKVLHIEHQRLGLQGASTLATVLEENQSLVEIYCENNEINLQAFTVLVNSLERNTTLLFLPSMEKDRAWTQKKVDREIDSIRDDSSIMSKAGMSPSAKATVHRTLGKTLGKSIAGQRSFSARNLEKSASPMQGYTESDIKAAMGSLLQNWERETARLQGFLARNCDLAQGSSLDGPPLLTVDSAESGEGLAGALRGIGLDDSTPIAEIDRQLTVDEPGIEDLAEDGEEVGEGALEMRAHSHV